MPQVPAPQQARELECVADRAASAWTGAAEAAEAQRQELWRHIEEDVNEITRIKRELSDDGATVEPEVGRMVATSWWGRGVVGPERDQAARRDELRVGLQDGALW